MRLMSVPMLVVAVAAVAAAGQDRTAALPDWATGDELRASPDDYPRAAMRTGDRGVVTVRLTVDDAGRVSGCALMLSSGSATLDQATCRMLRKRAPFPAGRPGKVVRRVLWDFPHD